VLLLSVKPCCTDADCRSKSFTSVASPEKSAPKEKDCQGCSPFFACGSCPGFVVTKALNYASVIIPAKMVKHTTQYRQPYIEAVTLSIWQPPQIS
jgi:hypothetical protein